MKRKRPAVSEELTQMSRPDNAETTNPQSGKAYVSRLELQLAESRKHYNNLTILLSLGREEVGTVDSNSAACVALCRAFCRLVTMGHLTRPKQPLDVELLVYEWLKQRYEEFHEILADFLRDQDSEKQRTGLTLLLRLAKVEIAHDAGQGDHYWRSGAFAYLMQSLLAHAEPHAAREEFVQSYMNVYDDIRFHSYHFIASLLSGVSTQPLSEVILSNSIGIMQGLDVPQETDELENCFVEASAQAQRKVLSLSAQKRQAQKAWVEVLKHPLKKEQRKAVLGHMTDRVAPWFSKVELLMDFLTDSYNIGGATSLLALSGLFFLIQEKNLDYPSFYQKLYVLLDGNLLHSKHRSRFFRLLETFMSSTHLPAALVASFIKRLARLALRASPAGIVAVIPWMYNMLKEHPACTFMIHRETRDEVTRKERERVGMADPFDMEESDPMQTRALESSLWEIETLQSHYHPQVATLAKIISEQFTKRAYNLEDFLNHTYDSILSAELGKYLKKTPVVEEEIPQNVFTGSDRNLSALGLLLTKSVEVS